MVSTLPSSPCAMLGSPTRAGTSSELPLRGPGRQHPMSSLRSTPRSRNWERDGYELRLGRLGVWRLEREVLASELRTLQGRAWTQASRVWSSVTPVSLDRHPGDLRSAKPGDRRRAYAKAATIVRDACVRVGLPEPSSIEFAPGPFLRGAAHVRRFRSPNNRRDHRPKLHVTLHFEDPVSGPVIIGAGRHRGLGLLRPMNEGGFR